MPQIMKRFHEERKPYFNSSQIKRFDFSNQCVHLFFIKDENDLNIAPQSHYLWKETLLQSASIFC